MVKESVSLILNITIKLNEIVKSTFEHKMMHLFKGAFYCESEIE